MKLAVAMKRLNQSSWRAVVLVYSCAKFLLGGKGLEFCSAVTFMS